MPSPGTSPAPPSTPPSLASRNRRLAGLVAVNLLSVLAQIVQIGTIAPLLALSLDGRGVDASLIGLVAAAPWAVILLVSRFVPRIIHRLGLAGTCLIAIALTLLALGGMAVVDDPLGLMALNGLAGLGLILRWIACDTWIVRVADDAIRGRAIGSHETLMGLGIALGPALIALTGHDGVVPFLAAGLLVAAGLVPLALLVRMGLNGRPGVPPTGRRAGMGLIRLLPVALLGAFACGVAETASIALLPLYAAAAGLGIVAAPLFATAFGTGGTVLQMPLGLVADRLGFRGAQLGCAALAVLGAALLPLVDPLGPWPWAGLPWLLVFLWGGAVGGMNTLAVIEAGARVDDDHMSAAMTAIAFAYTMGGFAGPAAAGVAMDLMSMNGLLMVAGGVALAVLLAGLWLGRRVPAAAPAITERHPSDTPSR
ncbi:MFS transporter [Tistrella sp. BH-R2-4]|uniref:MFS transporter n=1 Tax=Tistrella arctica TaxID=3133430 RepID=A0ABU9YR49_9PROT